MTLILTVPPRLAIMAADSTPLIKDSSDEFQKSLDTAVRPFVLVEIGSGEYPAVAAGTEEPIETFEMTIIGPKFGQGAKGDAEHELRQVTAALITYFQRHPSLQFSNTLRRQPAPLGALSGIKWARLYMREYCGVVTRSEPGMEPFWGTKLSFHCIEAISAQEEIVIDPSLPQ